MRISQRMILTLLFGTFFASFLCAGVALLWGHMLMLRRQPQVVSNVVVTPTSESLSDAADALDALTARWTDADRRSLLQPGDETIGGKPAGMAQAEASGDAGPLYVCDLHDHYLDHNEYCRVFSNPGEWCVRFGPHPESKDWNDLIYDYDVLNFAATLQGIVNKEGPRLYFIHDGEHVNGGSIDRFWLERFRDPDKPYGWLADREVIEINGVDGLLDTFADQVAGAVVWDTDVPATLNVATTIAGVEDLVVVRDGSDLQEQITARIPVQQSLVDKFVEGAVTIPNSTTPSTGSTKNDAYVWAKEQYLDTGKADPTLLAYFEDGWPVILYQREQMTRKGTYSFERDYAVQNRAFVFDLSPFATEAGSSQPEMPIDDPHQPPGADLSTFKTILESARSSAGKRMIRVWGFVPWYQKYTQAYEAGGTHTDVESEWESSWMFSSYGAYQEGGGGDVNGIALANMSLHTHAPFPERVPQNPPPTREQLVTRGYLTPDGQVVAKTYIMYYAGDYDLAHNVYGRTHEINSSLHAQTGQDIPLAWPLNPALVNVMPGIFNYFVTERSDKDFFVGPNSGAGYLNPGAVPDTLIPAWVAHSLQAYRRLGYTIQGWTLNGKGGLLAPKKAAMFLDMGGDGVCFYPSDLQGSWPRMERDIPVVAMAIPGIPWTTDEAVPFLHNARDAYQEQHGAEPAFLVGRLTCCSRSEYWDLTQRAKAEKPEAQYEVVDPYTFFYLLKVFMGGEIEYRATYLSDTMPGTVSPGQTIAFDVTIRNDGWDTWPEGAGYQLGVDIRPGAILPRMLLQDPNAYPVRAALSKSVPPGGTVTVPLSLVVSAEPGYYTVQFDVIAPDIGTFESHNDLPWQKVLNIAGG